MFDYSDREDLQGLYYAFDELEPAEMGETGADYLDEILDASEGLQDAADNVANALFDLWDSDPNFIEVCLSDPHVYYNVWMAFKTAGGVFGGILAQIQTEVARRRLGIAYMPNAN